MTCLGLGNGLKQLSTAELAKGFQVSDGNPILGIQPRGALLRSFGESLLAQPEIFGSEERPGNLVGGWFPKLLNVTTDGSHRLHDREL